MFTGISAPRLARLPDASIDSIKASKHHEHSPFGRHLLTMSRWLCELLLRSTAERSTTIVISRATKWKALRKACKFKVLELQHQGLHHRANGDNNTVKEADRFLLQRRRTGSAECIRGFVLRLSLNQELVCHGEISFGIMNC